MVIVLDMESKQVLLMKLKASTEHLLNSISEQGSARDKFVPLICLTAARPMSEFFCRFKRKFGTFISERTDLHDAGANDAPPFHDFGFR